MTFQLEIITPQREAFSKPVEGVYVPTKNGRIGVLPNHERLFTSLTEGEVKILVDGKDWYLAIGGGFMEVTKEKVSILVSRAVHADELNEKEIEKAYQDAKVALANKGKGREMADAQAVFRRSLLELRVVRRKERHRTLPTIS